MRNNGSGGESHSLLFRKGIGKSCPSRENKRSTKEPPAKTLRLPVRILKGGIFEHSSAEMTLGIPFFLKLRLEKDAVRRGKGPSITISKKKTAQTPASPPRSSERNARLPDGGGEGGNVGRRKEKLQRRYVTTRAA